MRNIVLVDDHELFRDGLRLVLEQIKDFRVVAEYASGDDFMEAYGDLDFDVVLLDINMPGTNGIKVTEQVSKDGKDFRIVGLSMLNDEVSAMNMIRAGADGFVEKRSGKYVLEMAINTVCSGGNYFSQDILMRLALGAKKGNTDPSGDLTEREKEVLIHICKGHSTNQIAELLFLSPKTVGVHRSNLLGKTGSKNAAQLVIWAIRNHFYTVH